MKTALETGQCKKRVAVGIWHVTCYKVQV